MEVQNNTAEDDNITPIFMPYAALRLSEVLEKGYRFVHYTNAEVAFNILTTGYVWMRNATTMNDFSEVQYGFECLAEAWQSEGVGGRLKKILDTLHPGISDDIAKRFNGWLPEFHNSTFLTCLSEHLPEEDEHGRLSMWRAYGGNSGVALVLNLTPFTAETDLLKAYSSPVAYVTKAQFADQMTLVCDNIEGHIERVREMNYELLYR